PCMRSSRCAPLVASSCLSFHATSTSAVSARSLHDALPIYFHAAWSDMRNDPGTGWVSRETIYKMGRNELVGTNEFSTQTVSIYRSEEHTSELQSRENLVCRLLLENKKNHDEKALPNAEQER